MDVSNRAEQNQVGGHELIDTVVSLTGLPEGLVQEELGQIIQNAGHSTSTVTLDQLREAMLAYLESVQLAMDPAATTQAE